MIINPIIVGGGSGGGKVWFGAAIAPAEMQTSGYDPYKYLVFDTDGLFDGSEDVRIVAFPTCKTNNNLISFTGYFLCLGLAVDLLITQTPTYFHPEYGFPVWYPSQILLNNRGTTLGNTTVSNYINNGSYIAFPNPDHPSIFEVQIALTNYNFRVTNQNDYFRWFAIIAQIE